MADGFFVLHCNRGTVLIFLYLHNMYKYALAFLIFCAACSSKDEQFCECLSIGDELNKETSQFFEKAPSAEDQKRIGELKKRKTEACKNYTEMGGDEMRKRKEACENS